MQIFKIKCWVAQHIALKNNVICTPYAHKEWQAGRIILLMRYVHDIARGIIVKRAKKLMDNDIL